MGSRINLQAWIEYQMTLINRKSPFIPAEVCPDSGKQYFKAGGFSNKLIRPPVQGFNPEIIIGMMTCKKHWFIAEFAQFRA
ncbi:hypothetical protein D3C76_1643940 [compost metagenome]